MLAACRRYLGLGLLAFTSGCAMCGSCDDQTYGAYGGRWERLDPCYGRVGSAFTPEVGTQVFADEQLIPAGDPQQPEEVTPGAPNPGAAVPDAPAAPDAMPGEDAPPAPPELMLQPKGKSADTSVLRRPAKPNR